MRNSDYILSKEHILGRVSMMGKQMATSSAMGSTLILCCRKSIYWAELLWWISKWQLRRPWAQRLVLSIGKRKEKLFLYSFREHAVRAKSFLSVVGLFRVALCVGHEPSMFVEREKEAMHRVSTFFAIKRNSYICWWRACLEYNLDNVDDGNSASHEPNYGWR